MTQALVLKHEFVDFIPDSVEEGKIYVSIQYATAIHKCCCGCGREVVTPISPTDWSLTYDGRSISLDPSIGNWSFECQSHYWVLRNQVKWAPKWSKERIEAGRAFDRSAKSDYFSEAGAEVQFNEPSPDNKHLPSKPWHQFKRWWR